MKLNPSELIAKEIPVEKVKWDQTKPAAETLHRAFAVNPLMELMENAARNPNRAIHENFTAIIARARTNGVVMRTSPQHEGIAVWYLTGFTRSNLLMDVRLAIYKIRSFRVREIGRGRPGVTVVLRRGQVQFPVTESLQRSVILLSNRLTAEFGITTYR